MLNRTKEIPSTQEEQLTWLYELTDIKWEVSSMEFVNYCATQGLSERIFVALPVGHMGHYTVYAPEGSFCSYSVEFIAKLQKLLSQFPENMGLSFKFDLNNLPEVNFIRKYPFGTLSATFGLDGDIICSPLDNRLPITVGFNSHAIGINASDTLERFIRTMKLNLKLKQTRTRNIGLGYSVADKEHNIWNTSITVYPNRDFDAATNPQPIATQFSNWEIEGQLGFKVSGRWIDRTDNMPEEIEVTSNVWETTKQVGINTALAVGFVALAVWRATPVGFAVTSAASLTLAAVP